MDKTFSVGIDHCTIIHKDLTSASDVFFPLGFVGDGNCRTLSEQVLTSFVPSVRFVFDNAYVESAQFPPELKEFYHFRKSDAGLHMITLLTDDAIRFRNTLIARGSNIPEITVTEREGADHGAKKGKAVFHLVEIPDAAVPDTHVAFLEHKTRELLYQPSRYRHPNTAACFKQMILCSADAALADRIETQLQDLCALANSNGCPGGMREMRIVDPDSFLREFHFPAEEKRCIFSALRFGVEDLSICRSFVEASGFAWKENAKGIFVNATNKLSLVFCFEQLPFGAGSIR